MPWPMHELNRAMSRAHRYARHAPLSVPACRTPGQNCTMESRKAAAASKWERLHSYPARFRESPSGPLSTSGQPPNPSPARLKAVAGDDRAVVPNRLTPQKTHAATRSTR